jgi:tRNA(Ile)-lysidine synthetase-like protein
MEHPEYLDKIFKFWFPNDKYNNFWFDGSCDEYISKEFSDILKMAENNELSSWEKNINSILGLVILFDQFTRNIYRNNISRTKNDTIAVKLCLKVLENNQELELSINKRIFFLLPLRHQKKTELLNYVMKKIYIYEKEEKEKNNLLEKFKYATLKNYTNLEDTIQEYNNLDKITFLDNKQDILDDNSEIYRNEINEINLEKISKYKSNLINNICEFYKTNKLTNIGVSLSGGVDSMVLLYISKYLEITGKINKVIAVHLEYINREESKYESEYLLNWCKFYNIPIIIRKIDHLGRDDLDRNFYEEETRKIRFNLYKYIMKKYNTEGIGLGHHYGDLGENVLMNIFNGRDILDLCVMQDISSQEQVLLLRPMLKNPKKDIIDFAHLFHIPYTKDTTPDWSCRGVLRRKIFPNLVNQYGLSIYLSLEKIGEKSKQWNEIFNTFILKPIINKIKFYKYGASLEISEDFLILPEIIWSKIFIELFHKLSKNMITHKCLKSYISWLNSKSENLFQFSNKTEGFIKENILYINNLPNIFNLDKNMNITSNLISNNWKIEITKLEEKQEIKNLEIKDILNGEINYIILSQSDELILINKLEKKDKNRKIFNKISFLQKYIPKITQLNNNHKKIFYRINAIYI